MKILIYNTLGRRKEEFKPIKAGHLSFYYCGPTVYWSQHIGNLRGSYCADIVHRTFKYLNYEVSMTRNYTDVGHLVSDQDEGMDKMTKTSQAENISPEEVANKFIKIFEEDVAKINILEPSFKLRATENIPEMIEMVQLLIAKGYAYVTDLAIYFEVKKFERYNELSGRKIEKNLAGAGRGLVSDEQKRDPQDFAIWFFKAGVHRHALQTWPSPFNSPLVSNGEGFPGWHLECSAMIKKSLGDTIDIHMGGIEHVSVHHSNEIAQSEAANGVKLANYWIHNEHLLINNGKMSKSSGTAYTLKDLEDKGFSPRALRYFYLQAHYRSQQNFTFEALKASQKALSGLESKLKKLGSNLGQLNEEFKNQFLEYLLDDFNVSRTLALISEILKSDISSEDKLATILDFDQVWGLNLASILTTQDSYPDEVKKIVEERRVAREKKDFLEADRLRQELLVLGYEINDGPDGAIDLIKK